MENYLNLEFLLVEHFEFTVVAMFALLALWQVLTKRRREVIAKEVYRKVVEAQMHEPISLHPEIDPNLCAGCGNCTRVCPEGDIMRMIDHQAVLVAPTQCIGHGECELACPTGAIRLVFGTKTRGQDIPRISGNYETNVPGLYIAGELGGMGLIRNAIKQGSLAAKHALANLGAAGAADYDLCVIGAGPAGLAASLTAIRENKTYVCIEQNSFGGTVYNYPKQKLVMTSPAVLPVVGNMKFSGNRVTKEDLLGFWERVRKQTGLKITEKTKFERLMRVNGVFEIHTNKGTFKARKVILAMGLRGSPRKLGLANEDLPKVTYNLLDPDQYQGKHISVVGGGNAAVEAAQYLSREKYGNKVKLLVRGPTFDRCNEDNKQIINEMAARGLMEIWYNSSVKEIKPDQIIVDREGKPEVVANEFLFIFAGAELPHKFLMSLGIEIEKKFGEAA